MRDIVFSSTTQLAAAIRAGHVSATEVLEAHLAQIDKHNPALNAIITLDAEQAYERAREADAALARGEVWGPLHGVPFTLKDAHATAGMRTTVGFPPLADHVPQEDGTVAARLKAAGGVLMGKTNVAAMLADYQTSNPVFGRTNNPWDLKRTPGGSSGGAGAAAMREAVEEMAQQLSHAGAVVEEAKLPGLEFHQELASAGELIGMMTGAFQPEEQGQPVTLAHYLEALHRRDRSIVAWEQFFD